eukprot:111855_1
MTEEKGYRHDKLIIKCQINSDQSAKTEAIIKNAYTFDQLLSNIIKAFPFLKHTDKSQWNICINSQVINNNDMDKFKSILSNISQTPTIDIVWKTSREKPVVNNTEVKIMPKYLINVDFEGTKFIHKIYKDIDDWDEQIVDDLKSAISQKFDLNITSFNLFDEAIAIDDIDDIIS